MFRTALFALLLVVVALPVRANHDNTRTAVGAGVGAALGAVIGNELGGRNEAIIGGAIGGAVGAAVARDHAPADPSRPLAGAPRLPQRARLPGLPGLRAPPRLSPPEQLPGLRPTLRSVPRAGARP